MSLILQKSINSKDGKGKEIKNYPLSKDDISEKEPQLICSNCKQLGVRTKGWKDDLYGCTNSECDVLWYWQEGVYYA